MIDQSVGNNPALFEKDVATTRRKTLTSMPEAPNESERYIVAQVHSDSEAPEASGRPLISDIIIGGAQISLLDDGSNMSKKVESGMRKEHSCMRGDDRLASYLETEIRKCGSNGLPSPTETSYTEGIGSEFMGCADRQNVKICQDLFASEVLTRWFCFEMLFDVGDQEKPSISYSPCKISQRLGFQIDRKRRTRHRISDKIAEILHHGSLP